MGVKIIKKDHVGNMNLESLKYPIGTFDPPEQISIAFINQWIEDLADFPNELINLTKDLTKDDLLKKHRKGGWNVKQVIHHLADSHVNAYTRIKLTLTENTPIIRPYDEVLWAELADSTSDQIALSIAILTTIHARLVLLLKAINEIDFERKYIHPATQLTNTLGYLIGNYAWHGKHHIAHIKLALASKN